MGLSAAMFDELVKRAFAPLAVRAGAELTQLREGIYEISGPTFVLRVRRGTGHSKDFLVTLSAKRSGNDLDDLSSEVGLAVIAEYYGRPLTKRALYSPEDWELALAEASQVAATFCLPYLRNEQTDLSGIELFIRTKIQAAGPKGRFVFPANVKKKWT